MDLTVTRPSARQWARPRWTGPWAWWLAGALVPLVAVLIMRTVDMTTLKAAVATMMTSPGEIVIVGVVYTAAFVLRAIVWTRVLPGLSVPHALAAIHVSVGANHVLPLRLGEVLRVTSVVRRTTVSAPLATMSTVTLRAADVLAIAALAVILGPGLAWDVLGVWGPALLLLALITVVLIGQVWTRSREQIRALGPFSLGLVAVSWMLEGVVIYQAAAWAGVTISPAQAVLVTAVTIAAQIVAIAPGGFGTYEAAATLALAAVGVDPGTGLAIAVTAHAVKTVYALATGAAAAVWPQPSLFGRFRLARSSDLQAAPPARVDPAAPVVLFMPAHNEEESVAAVVRRVPRQVHGHPVHCLVIDDGSTDATAGLAHAAGAEVVSLQRNMGLGAAVRRGLAEGTQRGAVAVVFCDADGEYAPEELDRMVAPILSGTADYVVGSRFAGTIGRMLPHRRFGNRVLTMALRFISRAPISDGQSGYRALSSQAAAQAQVIHDFNYAQVLTLDLLARGARYTEVPISYRFRTHGRSFVRLGRYLAAVIPAVHRQLNAEVSPLVDSPRQQRDIAPTTP